MESVCNGDGGNSVNIVETVGAEYPRVLVRFSSKYFDRLGRPYLGSIRLLM